MKFPSLISLLLFAGLFSSCTSYKKVPYLQSDLLKNGNGLSLSVNYKKQDVVFLPDDVLSITINASQEPAAALAFNLPMQPSAIGHGEGEDVSQGIGRQSYQVNSLGEISFPVLGSIQVGGKTQEEVEKYLKQALKAYIKEETVVTVKLLNFRISVLGEVSRPGQYAVSKSRINVLEALSLGGDMTIYGRRDKVTILREGDDGVVTISHLDISSADAVLSPDFYLRQNDIVYVEPNKARSQSAGIGTGTTIWFSVGSILLSVATFIVSLTR
jgi:Periplasmic protein involved in polysaccharide export